MDSDTMNRSLDTDETVTVKALKKKWIKTIMSSQKSTDVGQTMK